jgi:hypothetical protein
MEDRLYWGRLCTALRDALIEVENTQEKLLKAKVGVWIERFTPLVPAGTLMNMPAGALVAEAPAAAGASATAVQPSSSQTEPAAELRADPSGSPPAGAPPPRRSAKQARSSGEITSIRLLCRAVSLTPVAADANTKLSYAVQEILTNRTQYAQFFDAGTELVGQIKTDNDRPDALTFTFEVLLKLKRPMKL